MPTRDSTAEDMLDGFNLKAIVDAKLADVRSIDADVQARRLTIENAYTASVKEATALHSKAVSAANAKREKALMAQDSRIQGVSEIAKAAQKDLNDFQDKLQSETGVRVPLPGDASAAPRTMSV